MIRHNSSITGIKEGRTAEETDQRAILHGVMIVTEVEMYE